jgi:hypothetical protein
MYFAALWRASPSGNMFTAWQRAGTYVNAL